ncbi:hypothetical protein F4824DRAFT_476004 [Ustulina deusta]|nr:hypothetical protein F4824DRAFT_476004 [Ustulina deusta]
MALPCSFSSADALMCLRTYGFFVLEDALVGKRVSDFDQRGLPFKTPYGLDFCAQNTLDNKDIRSVVESTIDRPRWGLIKVYSDKLPPNLAFFFHNRLGQQMPTILIQLWGPDSSVVFYEGTHLQNVDAKESKSLEESEGKDWGLLALPRTQMRRHGIVEKTVEMKQGGLVLLDGRLGFTILNGYVFNIGFAAEAEIQFWAKMDLPASDEIKAKVDELQQRLNTNFTFVGGQETGQRLE